MPKITTSLPIYVFDFEPPLLGMEGRFNTFRLGRRWSKELKVGRAVLLMDSKAKAVFGKAKVEKIEYGTLEQMALLFAFENHNQLGKVQHEAAEDLVARARKRYGPHIATDNKGTTVIWLKRTG